MLAGLKISTKIFMVNLLIIICFSIAFAWVYTRASKDLYDTSYANIRQSVESAWNIMDYYSKQVDAGILSDEKAKEATKEVIRSLRSNGKDSYWINDTHLKMIMHSARPELEGKDFANLEDTGAKGILALMVDTGKKKSSGFVDHHWPKSALGEAGRRVAFVKMFPKWGWIMGSSISFGLVSHELSQRLYVTLSILATLTLLCLSLSYFVNKKIVGQIDHTISVFKTIVKEKDFRKRLIQHGVNCSKLMNCPRTDCPEYGNITDCWNRLGSNAVEAAQTNKCYFLEKGAYSHCAQCLIGKRVLTNEMDKLAGWINTFIKSFQGILSKIQGNVDDLNTSSGRLSWISDDLASKARKMSSRSSEAATAAEMTADNIKNIAAAAEEVSTQAVSVALSSEEASSTMHGIETATSNVSHSVNTIASAIEEMYSSLNEVAKNSSRGAFVTKDASNRASKTSEIVNKLGEAAKEIGIVVDLIKGIAAQTNLLSLNAAIEAAGAGEAGKGFAVVAKEVKELARQTAGATEGIREKVESMQANTESAVRAIESIVGVITEINTIMGTIASAVEEQTATTNEISKSISVTANAADLVSNNVREAAKFNMEVSRSIDEVAKAAVIIAKDAAEASSSTDRVTRNITDMNEAVSVASQSASQTKCQAEDLAVLARQLQAIIGQFTV